MLTLYLLDISENVKNASFMLIPVFILVLVFSLLATADKYSWGPKGISFSIVVITICIILAVITPSKETTKKMIDVIETEMGINIENERTKNIIIDSSESSGEK